MLLFFGEYLYEKKKCSWIPSKYIDDKRILQSDWMRVFWPKLVKQNFPRYGVCTGK